MAERPQPTQPPLSFDCGSAAQWSEFLASPASSIEETRGQLPLMHELYQDTVLVWDQFGIQPDHMMFEGLPRMLVRTDDAAGRCEQILETVARPDLVLFVEWSEEEYDEALDRGMPPWRLLIETDLDNGVEDPVWTSMGTGLYGVTSLTLRSDQEELAATLLDRYEELIKLSVGNFAYPPERIDPGGRSRCQTLPEAAPPTDLTIRSMSLLGDVETGQVEVIVSNDGTTTVHLVPSRIAELAAPGGSELVSVFTGAMTTEDRGSVRLDPGEEVIITARPSTTSCSADVGYALPAGSYDLVLPIHVFDSEASENDTSDRLLLPRLEIELQ